MNNRIIVRKKLEKGKKYISFIIRLRHSLSEVFFAENSWGKIGSSTFVLGADQRLSGEGVFNSIYYCPLGFRALCTFIPLCMSGNKCGESMEIQWLSDQFNVRFIMKIFEDYCVLCLISLT